MSGGVGGGVLRRVVVVALLAMVLVVAPPLAAGPVSACSCAGLTDAEAFATADVVFAGRLVEVRVPDGPMISSDDPARFVFEVDTVLKGEAFETQSVVSARDGASCGLELPAGVDVVVFARTQSAYELADGELDSSLCSGSRVGEVPAGLGDPAAPQAGSSAIGSFDDNRLELVVGAVIVLAAAGLAIAGVVLGRRSRRATSG
jgi:hypothetical protein